MVRLSSSVIAAALSLITLVAASGCSGLALRPVLISEPLISPQLQVPALMSLKDRGSLTLKQLEEGLRKFVNEGTGPVADRLKGLYGQWRLQPFYGTVQVLEADLDGDGTKEILTTLNDASSAAGSGSLFVIYKQGDRYEVDRSPETVIGAGLYAAADVDRDGRAEIVWSATSPGANTLVETIYVSKWRPGHIENLPDPITATYAKVEAAGSDLLVTGGLYGGYGAGKVQRALNSRYAWQNGQLKRVDRRFAPSDYGYHRLMDGLLAEMDARQDEAAAAFRDAMDPGRPALFTEDTIPAEWVGRFPVAVRTFARFRLGLHDLKQNRTTEADQVLSGGAGPYAGLQATLRDTTPENGCTAATAWATANPEFLQALNIPRGWANPQWKPEDLCGPLPLKLQ